MLYSILLTIGLLASPAQWCGGGRMCCVPQRTKYVPQLVAPAPRPLTIYVPSFLRTREVSEPVRLGLMLIAPRSMEMLQAAAVLTDGR